MICAAQRRPRAADGRFRLAVDRSFTLVGTGTVVTGTVLSGQVAVGDAVLVSPSGLEARVRSLHVQNRAAQRGQAGERCALALAGAGITKEAIGRGDVVLDPSLHAPTNRIDARLRVLKSEVKPIGQWMPVRFHHGASDLAARLVVLREEPIEPGETDLVQIVLDRPIAAAAGDRFILRDTSAGRTIGGGVLIDLRAPERRRRTPERRAELLALDAIDSEAALSAALNGPRGYVDLEAFFRDRAAAATAASEAIARARPGRAVVGPAIGRDAAGDLAAFQRCRHCGARCVPCRAARSARPGTGAAAAVAPAALARALVRRGCAAAWWRRGQWCWIAPGCGGPHHEVRMSPDEERVWARSRPLLAELNRFRPPRVRDVAREFGIDEKIVRRVFKLAARRGEAGRGRARSFLPGRTVARWRGSRSMSQRQAEGGRFGAAEFRDRLENGRKVAIQILEYFDRQGFTMRRGDWRRINPQPHGRSCCRTTQSWRRCVPGGASGLQIREGPRDGPWWVRLPLSSASVTRRPPMSGAPRSSRRSRPRPTLRPPLRRRSAGKRPSASRLLERDAQLRVPPHERDAPDRGSGGARGERGAGGRGQALPCCAPSSAGTSDSEARSAILARFAPVIQGCSPDSAIQRPDAPPADMLARLAEFEAWYAGGVRVSPSGTCSISRCRRPPVVDF